MGKITKLLVITGEIESLDPTQTIYASEPWGFESEAVLAYEPESGGIPKIAIDLGLTYFLEVFIAQEIIADWKSTLKKQPTADEKCIRLIQYALNDA